MLEVKNEDTKPHVEKRNGDKVVFNEQKIIHAVLNANRDVAENDRISVEDAEDLAREITERYSSKCVKVEEIQDCVEELLLKKGYVSLGREYIKYRYKRALIRKSNSTDDSILSLLRGENEDLSYENSNKNTSSASTQRDYMAGVVSRDLTKRILLPKDVVRAHEMGSIHFHDMDYFIQEMFNCCLANIQDMLENGTVMNGKMVESPKSFQVACTVMTQIIASVASHQYGGQSVDIRCLGHFVDISRQKYLKHYTEKCGDRFSEEDIRKLAEDRVRDEIKSGVQTIQYQINTLMTTNGQSPFVTLFLYLDEEDPYLNDTAMVIEEILRQRIVGVKNSAGVYTTPAFPKLVYVLDENNCLKGGRFDYLTHLAAKCSAKRMYPDYISAKILRKNYEGNVFPPMGCRSFLSPWKDENGKYKFFGRFNQGVVTINLPQVAILAKGNEEKFWDILEQRLLMCRKALMCRHNALMGTKTYVSPIHWENGAIARKTPGDTIDDLLCGGYSTLSLGYIGVYETTRLMTGFSHTTEVGKEFALRVMHRLRSACDSWKESTGLGFALYGTPAESVCYSLAKKDAENFGDEIPEDMYEDIVGKGYYTNSYHVDVREKITAFDKLAFESEFQNISSGGAISYVELPSLNVNIDAIEALIKFIYENIQYAEFNTKSDYCYECGYSGEMIINDDNHWECPQCHNKNEKRMSVVRRTCGYLGENFWNAGKTKEMKQRVLHL